MTASYSQIAKAVLGLANKGKPTEQIVQELAHYLLAERRTNELDRIMREAERLRLEQSGILEVEIISVREISPQIEEAVSRLFNVEAISITRRKDASLVGGVLIKTLDSQLDLSVRGRLKKLANSI